MSEPFKPMDTTEENSHVDRFGNTLNVGDRVLFPGTGEIPTMFEGTIIAYDQLWYNIGEVIPVGFEPSGDPIFGARQYSWYQPKCLVNINTLPIDPVAEARQKQFLGPLMDHTPSSGKKCSRKYVVALVGDYLNHSWNETTTRDKITELQVVITSIPGSTTADWRRFDDYLHDMYDAKVISFLCTSNKRFSGSYYGVKADDCHNWNVIQYKHYVDWRQSSPGDPVAYRIAHCNIPQSEYQLSKRRMQDYGLLEHLDTAMTVAEFNAIVSADGQWKYFE